MGVYKDQYETVAASQTDQILGPTGAVGDRIFQLIITVDTSATGTVELQDGDGTAFQITAANTPIGVYPVGFGRFGVRARNATTPGWKVTTGAGATVVAIGDFT